MKKILFYLFCAITLTANASMPVVNDSVLVEPKYDKETDLFLKSLPDSVYEMPMVSKFFGNIGDVGNINISLIEQMPINEEYKNHYLRFSISDIYSSLGILMTYEDVQSIISILKGIYENTQNLRLSGEKENISYKKLVSSRSLFAISLSYNPQKDKWNCQIDISIVNPTDYVGKSVMIYQDLDYKKNCRLKNYNKDILELIKLLEQGLKGIAYRKYRYEEPQLKVEEKKGLKEFYIEGSDNPKTLYNDVVGNSNYNENLYKERYIEPFNHVINGEINNHYKKLKELSDYGVVEVIINSSGKVVFTKMLLKEVVANTLDERSIVKLLHCIKDYSFKSYKEDYPDVKLIKVYIPLKGRP